MSQRAITPTLPVFSLVVSLACTLPPEGVSSEGPSATGEPGETLVDLTTGSRPEWPLPTSTLNPAICGDGEIAGAEECDDGNFESDDACLNDCRSASCGDGIVRDGVEACDDGDLVDSNACTGSCIWARCGDGLVWEGAEECDDGNGVDADECTNTCKFAVCGDGVKRPSEECDDGSDNIPGNWAQGKECTTTCKLACGDGIRGALEACDDGDHEAADGCDATCEVEHLIFVTRALFPANFGGIAAADAICQAAAGGRLTGTYVAWLSSTYPADHAFTDLPIGHPLIRSDGALVVEDAEDLLWKPKFALLSPIDRDEDGNPVGGYVWTGTEISGQASGLDCDNWTTSESSYHAGIGEVEGTALSWTNASGVAPPAQGLCGASNHLYCFRKAEP